MGRILLIAADNKQRCDKCRETKAPFLLAVGGDEGMDAGREWKKERGCRGCSVLRVPSFAASVQNDAATYVIGPTIAGQALVRAAEPWIGFQIAMRAVEPGSHLQGRPLECIRIKGPPIVVSSPCQWQLLIIQSATLDCPPPHPPPSADPPWDDAQARLESHRCPVALSARGGWSNARHTYLV